MKLRTRSVIAIGAGLTAMGVGAAPAAAAVIRETENVAGDVLVCDGKDLTITEGQLNVVFHEGTSPSGNLNYTVTVTLKGVMAEDADGNEYNMRGALWFGGTYNANQGTGQETFTGKTQIVQQGSGTAGSINLTVHVSPNGKTFEKDFGTCTLPE